MTHGGGEGVNIPSNFISLDHMVWDRQGYEDISTKDHLINELMNNKGFCRLAPATPGLSKIILKNTNKLCCRKYINKLKVLYPVRWVSSYCILDQLHNNFFCSKKFNQLFNFSKYNSLRSKKYN